MNHWKPARSNPANGRPGPAVLLYLGLVALVLMSAEPALSQGNILTLPRRVVFEGNKRTQELTVANTGRDTSKYVVSVVQLRMKEDGSVEEITEPDSGQLFADKYFRFFPRTVTLPPGQSQVIKMQLNKTANLAPGEYRSHIYFRAIKDEAPLGELGARDSTAVTISLVPVFGITIPAIIRVGNLTSDVTITDTQTEMTNDTTPRLRMVLNRKGGASVYGDIQVNHVAPDGTKTKAALVKGVAVYTPNTVRRFHCNLDTKAGINYKTGKLSITYSTADDVKAATIAETELILR